jgi:hypothetical protein
VFHSGDSGSAKLLSIDIRWTGEPGNEEQIADQVAKVIIQNDQSIQNYTRMRVTITRGARTVNVGYWLSKKNRYTLFPRSCDRGRIYSPWKNYAICA